MQFLQNIQSVWPAGHDQTMNAAFGFRAVFHVDDLAAPIKMRASGASFFRVWVNGKWLDFGPARAGKGGARIDEWDITALLQRGENLVAFEVWSYGVPTYVRVDEPPFLCAQITQNEAVLAGTTTHSPDFAPFGALNLPGRSQKMPRYSFQRAFCEGARLVGGENRWREDLGFAFAALPFESVAAPTWFERRVRRAHCEVLAPQTLVKSGIWNSQTPREEWLPGAIEGDGPHRYARSEWEWDAPRAFASGREVWDETLETDADFPRKIGGAALYDFGRNLSGFIGLRAKCAAKTTVLLAFDERLSEGEVDFRHADALNLVPLELGAGAHEWESAEPYTLRFLQIVVLEGEIELETLGLRTLQAPLPQLWRAQNAEAQTVLDAALATFAQNAVDIFTDCPSRERAGWLCDSFFLGRVASQLHGDLALETNFLENFARAESFPALPEGMVPMCYPADHPNGVFIPQWALWLVLQVEEFAARGGDAALLELLRPRVEGILGWCQGYRNADGLLENLPSWNFLEWSRANELVRDVNFPTNFLYSRALEAAATTYSHPAWAAQAALVRSETLRQSDDGQFFVDNAVRDTNGLLVSSGQRTETAQYYAFWMGAATPQSHPKLWQLLLSEFGVNRKDGAWDEIAPSNLIVGHLLRLELLARQGLHEQLGRETLAYFGPMARRTGTLWEHNGDSASCSHGIASHAVLWLRDAGLATEIHPKVSL